MMNRVIMDSTNLFYESEDNVLLKKSVFYAPSTDGRKSEVTRFPLILQRAGDRTSSTGIALVV